MKSRESLDLTKACTKVKRHAFTFFVLIAVEAGIKWSIYTGSLQPLLGN